MYCIYLDQNNCQNVALTSQCAPLSKSLPLNLSQDISSLLPVTYLPYTNALDMQASLFSYQTAVNLKFKQDTSHHHHIFVGDLCPYLQPMQLLEAFRPFGRISECKIIQDAQTLKSKGYGFVTFVQKEDAQNAIDQMNCKVIGSRAIRTNWAVRRVQNNEGTGNSNLIFEEVMKTSTSNNCVIYCGGVQTGLTEELMHETFKQYGSIVDVKLFKDKGYAFIRYSKKEDAGRAIVDRHLSTINGYVVRCSWGKKIDDPQFQEGGATTPKSSDEKSTEEVKQTESVHQSVHQSVYDKYAQAYNYSLTNPAEYDSYNLPKSNQCYSAAPIFAMQPHTNYIMYPNI